MSEFWRRLRVLSSTAQWPCAIGGSPGRAERTICDAGRDHLDRKLHWNGPKGGRPVYTRSYRGGQR